MKESIISTVGVIAAIVLPLFNIPLILKMIKRKSSNDLSLCWALGVWVCIILMAPSGFTSKDIVWKVFNIINLLAFSLVVIIILKYRKKSSQPV